MRRQRSNSTYGASNGKSRFNLVPADLDGRVEDQCHAQSAKILRSASDLVATKRPDEASNRPSVQRLWRVLRSGAMPGGASLFVAAARCLSRFVVGCGAAAISLWHGVATAKFCALLSGLFIIYF